MTERAGPFLCQQCGEPIEFTRPADVRAGTALLHDLWAELAITPDAAEREALIALHWQTCDAVHRPRPDPSRFPAPPVAAEIGDSALDVASAATGAGTRLDHKTVVARFFRAVERLEEQGANIQHSRRGDRVAYWLEQVAYRCYRDGIALVPLPELRSALPSSRSPKFLGTQTLKIQPGKQMKECWVFSRA